MAERELSLGKIDKKVELLTIAQGIILGYLLGPRLIEAAKQAYRRHKRNSQVQESIVRAKKIVNEA